MARTLNATIAAKQFHSNYNSALGLVEKVEPYLALNADNIGSDDFHPLQARKIIALAFMGLVASWEGFLEDVFIRYMAGAKTVAGYSPTLKSGACKSLSKAYEVFTGKPGFDPELNYLSWTDYSRVIKRAETFFRDGKPFSDISGADIHRIADAVIIRNRIAHASSKSKSQFKKVALRHFPGTGTKLPAGLNPGSLLMQSCNVNFSKQPDPKNDTFYAYADLFARCVHTICPS